MNKCTLNSICLVILLALPNLAHSASEPLDSKLINNVDRPDSAWAESTLDEFLGFGLLREKLWQPKYRIDELASLEIRLNKFASKIHREMLELSIKAPAPKVKIVAWKESTAFITALRVCLPIELKIKPLIPSPLSKGVAELHIHDKGASQARPPVHRGGATCIPASWFDPVDIDKAIQQVNSQSPCQITGREGSYQITESTNCKIGTTPDRETRSHLPISGAKSIVIDSVSNTVIMTTAFLSKFRSEEELLSVVAHELGHYYQAHPIVWGRGDYWYNHTEPPRRKYSPLTIDQAFTKDIYTTWDQNTFRRTEPTSIQFSVFHPITAFFNLRVVPDLITQSCTNSDGSFGCDDSCKIVSQTFSKNESSWFNSFSRGFKVLSKETWGEVNDYAKSITHCTQKIPLQHENVIGADGKFIFDKLKTGQVPVQFLESNFKTYMPHMAFKIPSTAKTVFDAIGLVSKIGTRIEEHRQDVANYLQAKKLIFRTIEVEADETSLLLGSLGGIHSSASIESHLSFLKDSPEDYRQCLESYSKNFKVEGETMFLLQGLHMLKRQHPDHCARAFYIHRQNEAHNFRVDKVWSPLSSSSWKNIQALASEITQEHSKLPRPDFTLSPAKPIDPTSPVPSKQGLIME